MNKTNLTCNLEMFGYQMIWKCSNAWCNFRCIIQTSRIYRMELWLETMPAVPKTMNYGLHNQDILGFLLLVLVSRVKWWQGSAMALDLLSLPKSNKTCQIKILLCINHAQKHQQCNTSASIHLQQKLPWDSWNETWCLFRNVWSCRAIKFIVFENLIVNDHFVHA